MIWSRADTGGDTGGDTGVRPYHLPLDWLAVWEGYLPESQDELLMCYLAQSGRWCFLSSSLSFMLLWLA